MQPVGRAQAATHKTHNKQKRRTSTFSPAFEPAIPVNKSLQTCALDRTAYRNLP